MCDLFWEIKFCFTFKILQAGYLFKNLILPIFSTQHYSVEIEVMSLSVW